MYVTLRDFGQDVPDVPALPDLPEIPTPPVAPGQATTLPLVAILAGGILVVGGLTTQRVGTTLLGSLLAGVGFSQYPWWQETKKAVGLEGGYG